MKLTITLVQMDIALGHVEENLARGEVRVAEAARRGSDLVVLPELWTTGYDLEHADRHAARLDESPFTRVASWARRYGVWVTGSILERWQGGFANAAVVFSPAGDMAGIYRKVHLFRLMDEDRYLIAGDQAPLFDLPWGRTALAICYDLRFPELFRGYAAAGARLLLLPAEWPHPRVEHWRTLVRARAIENQMVVAACNRVGEGGDAHFCGHSAIVSPWGEVLAEAGEQEILLTSEVTLVDVDRVRKHIPVFQDRRPEVYRDLEVSAAAGVREGSAACE